MVIPPLSKSLPSARPVAGRTALLNCVETCYVDTDHDTWIKIVVALMYSYISIAIVGSRLVSCCQCLDINGFQHGPSFETLQMNFIPRTFWFSMQLDN